MKERKEIYWVSIQVHLLNQSTNYHLIKKITITFRSSAQMVKNYNFRILYVSLQPQELFVNGAASRPSPSVSSYTLRAAVQYN